MSTNLRTKDKYKTYDYTHYLFGNIWSESITSTTGGDTPTIAIFRVRPHQITDGSLMRHLLGSSQGLDLVNGVEGRTEACMGAEDLSSHTCC
jgi:hypothetical protein